MAKNVGKTGFLSFERRWELNSPTLDENQILRLESCQVRLPAPSFPPPPQNFYEYRRRKTAEMHRNP